MQRFKQWKSNRAAAKEDAARAAEAPESEESYDEEENSQYSDYESEATSVARSHASAKPAPNPVGDAAAATAGWLNSAWGATTAAISQVRRGCNIPCTQRNVAALSSLLLGRCRPARREPRACVASPAACACEATPGCAFGAAANKASKPLRRRN